MSAMLSASLSLFFLILALTLVAPAYAATFNITVSQRVQEQSSAPTGLIVPVEDHAGQEFDHRPAINIESREKILQASNGAISDKRLIIIRAGENNSGLLNNKIIWAQTNGTLYYFQQPIKIIKQTITKTIAETKTITRTISGTTVRTVVQTITIAQQRHPRAVLLGLGLAAFLLLLLARR